MKKAIVILLAIVLIAGGFLLYTHFKKEKIAELKRKLQQRIHEETDGLYHLTWGKLEVDEVGKRLHFFDVQLETDSSFNMGATSKRQSLPFITLHIPSLEINGYRIDKKEKTIEADEIKMVRANLILSVNRSEQDSTGNWQSEMKEQILRKWNEVKIARIQLDDLSVKLMRKGLGTPQVEMKHATANFKQLVLNKKTAAQGSVIDSFSISSLQVKEFGWYDKMHFFKYRLLNINFSETDSKLVISNFNVQPQLSRQSFMSKIPHRKNYLTANCSNIHFRGFRLSFNPSISVTTAGVEVGGSVVSIERDHRLPHDGKNRVGMYPHQQLMRIPFPVAFKKVQLNNFNLTYKEVNPKTNQTGVLRFSNITASIQNITNDKRKILQQNTMSLALNGFFEQQIPLNLGAKFQLGHPEGAFQIHGQIGPLNLSAVNEVAMPMGSLRFEKGHISKFQFKMEGTDQGVKGNYLLLYRDLVIAAIDPQKMKDKEDKKKIMSWIMNLKLINANPGVNGQLRSPSIWTPRTTDRSILHLVWHSLFDGMMNTAMPSAKKKEP